MRDDEYDDLYQLKKKYQLFKNTEYRLWQMKKVYHMKTQNAIRTRNFYVKLVFLIDAHKCAHIRPTMQVIGKIRSVSNFGVFCHKKEFPIP